MKLNANIAYILDQHLGYFLSHLFVTNTKYFGLFFVLFNVTQLWFRNNLEFTNKRFFMCGDI